MKSNITKTVLVLIISSLNAQLANVDVPDQVPKVVTADIQAGIEKYIEDETVRGGGYFEFSSDGQDFSFKLVRVHTEYLANLGIRRHFACIDLVDTLGDVYDVDFFLSGDPGDMTITEQTLHKLNGIPFYTWEQNRRGTWQRVPMEEATPGLLGVIEGEDEFDFLYRVKLPEITDSARMWLPLPETDKFQTVEIKKVNPPKYRVINEPKYGNKCLFFEFGPEDSERTIDMRFYIKRKEKAAYTPDYIDREKYLEAQRLTPIDDNFKAIAGEVVAGKKSDLVRARALYDHVIDRMRYMKYGSGWGKGDAVYACDVRTGNCTDFHAYFISLSRAVGIPARFAIGAAIPSSRDDGGIDGYHCWVEFYSDGKWWPVDISEADKYSSLSTYYFGHHPANRLEFSRGRDLEFDPGPASGPINFLAYPVLEIEGKPVKTKTEFSFNRNVSHK
ncbi:MAG TPA: transglutaminase domain-containing protein [Candidatus Marinimicrobia bacterium]|jgi:transglutaminase-like putative cysteine protease|nr:transglutaminase [Candidatus Neomarinimicrobiota bacterium]MDP7329735.1 transglutaminase domain-containing protein [Candidatus Neomarinimicrobiota bacterium]HJL74722.1 transglutaminase domain-containing protein [Candidatus Neomarinimicrobiota bacterium]HJM70257.1 transglutaminase domain-containing protein [Candidatus Neomarinimicrobiota bacterium]|tara:strand:+ start:5443 stop:6777 length:1335 start_codon:yes stop_codon:yes gene_type:complete